MDTQTTEQELRCEAIRRRLGGERVGDICEALGRSPRWFHEWWSAYQQAPTSTLADRSRAPHTSPQAMPSQVVQAVISIRQLLEAARTSPGVKWWQCMAMKMWRANILIKRRRSSKHRG